MGTRKVQVYIVIPTTREPGDTQPPDRLIRGTLKEVETKLRGEVAIRPVLAEEAHRMADVEIEDASNEPA